jgi:hypothetical protein
MVGPAGLAELHPTLTEPPLKMHGSLSGIATAPVPALTRYLS